MSESNTPNANSHNYALLESIASPADLRKLTPAQLKTLAEELRHFLIESVSRTGGHLAAGLGVVELTLALHYVFDTPKDKLVWDVGHQAYPHKILTGRRDKMGSLRQKDGLCGFPLRTESDYDTFGVGHSSTSISAALGMAIGLKNSGQHQHCVAIIGDGALSGGMAFEALNHAGALDENLIVILNDNDMSISPPVGAISQHLAEVLSSKFYRTMREGGKTALSAVPSLRQLMGRWEEHTKGLLMPSALFEELGFSYFGPIDGHNLDSLLRTLENVKHVKGPRLLHVVTKKGFGYAPAEGMPTIYHGVSPFDKDTGKLRTSNNGKVTFTKVFGDWLTDTATQDQRLIGITPAMCEGSGLTAFAARFPERFFDVGIAEQHALTLAAGMACEGLKPVVAIYSTFLQRAYDQLIHDICLQNLDVTLAVDRGGLVGADGATHAGCFDLSFGRIIPNLVMMAPADENECRQMLQTAYEYPGPALVRYPRGAGIGKPVEAKIKTLPLGKGEIINSGEDIAILGFGTMVPVVLSIAKKLGATAANMRFIKPLDEDLIVELARNHQLIVTVEENVIAGGAGSAVAEVMAMHGINTPRIHLGIPDAFIPHASQAEQLAICGLDEAGITASIQQAMMALETQQQAVPQYDKV